MHVVLPVVVLQVVELQGYGGAARLCRRCTPVRAEHVVLLRSLSSVPRTFLATSRNQTSSMCFIQIVSLLVHLVFAGALASLQSTWAQSIEYQEQVHHENGSSCSTSAFRL